MTKSEDKVLLYDPTKCTGCRYCEIACSYYHFKKFDLDKAHLHVEFDEKSGDFEAIYCQHCDEPLCVAACPNDAAVKDTETGLVKINPINCIGCKTCTFSCPLSVPWFNKDYHVSMKCDFCHGDPQCAKFCSPQAMKVVKRQEAQDYNRRQYLKHVEMAEVHG